MSYLEFAWKWEIRFFKSFNVGLLLAKILNKLVVKSLRPNFSKKDRIQTAFLQATLNCSIDWALKMPTTIIGLMF